MRKFIIIFVSGLLVLTLLSACGNTDSKVDQVIQNQIQELEEEQNESEEITETEEGITETTEETEVAITETSFDDVTGEDVDIDLSKVSSTIAYSKLYDMTTFGPEKYVGQTVRIAGTFIAYTNKEHTLFYPGVIVSDATACCAQGLEFILEGEPPYPEGYPELQTEVTVVGTYETYMEDGTTYSRLRDARLE